jgi:hypothetical protein
MTYHLLYAKKPGSKRFMPMDYGRGAIVVNRIHATMFNAEETSQIRAELPLLEEINKGWRFELRSTR